MTPRRHVTDAIKHNADNTALRETENLFSPWAWYQVRDALRRNIHFDTDDHDGLPDLGWMVIVRGVHQGLIVGPNRATTHV